MNVQRVLHRLLADQENLKDSTAKYLNPYHVSRLERQGVQETNLLGEEREIVRLTRPLKSLVRDPETHELAVHQGLYIDPYVWEFRDGGRRANGTRKLEIACDTNPDLSSWRKAESGGFFKGTDLEVYNSSESKQYDDNAR